MKLHWIVFITVLVGINCYSSDNISKEETPLSNVVNDIVYNWKAGGRIGLINKFMRPEFKSWTVDSSSAFSLSVERVFLSNWITGLKFFYGFRLDNYKQTASYKNTNIEINYQIMDLPISSIYKFQNSDIAIGATVIFNLNKSHQSIFTTNRLRKSLKSPIVSNSIFGFEVFAEYEITKEVNYVFSYNSQYSTLYFGGLNYAF